MIDGTNFSSIAKPTSRTVFSKKGNPYTKTKAGKVASLVTAAGLSAIQTLKNKDEFIKKGNYFHDFADECKNVSAKFCINSVAACSFAKTLAKNTAIALIAGTAIDLLLNKIKSIKADKSATSTTYLVK